MSEPQTTLAGWSLDPMIGPLLRAAIVTLVRAGATAECDALIAYLRRTPMLACGDHHRLVLRPWPELVLRACVDLPRTGLEELHACYREGGVWPA